MEMDGTDFQHTNYVKKLGEKNKRRHHTGQVLDYINPWQKDLMVENTQGEHEQQRYCLKLVYSYQAWTIHQPGSIT